MLEQRPNYRHWAGEHLTKAREWMESDSDRALSYACLELRHCLEGISYDLLAVCFEDVPQTVRDTWQPPKVMTELEKFDPDIHKSVTVSIGVEEVPGTPSKQMQILGTDEKLDLRWLVSTYHKLGSYLHLQTPSKANAFEDPVLIPKLPWLEEVAQAIERVLSSTVFHVRPQIFHAATCACGGEVKIGVLELDRGKEFASCSQCLSAFRVTRVDEHHVDFEPVRLKWKCYKCEKENWYHRLLEENSKTECQACGQAYIWRHVYQLLPDESGGAPL